MTNSDTVEVSIYVTPETLKDIEKILEEAQDTTPGEAVSLLALYGDRFVEEYTLIAKWHKDWSIRQPLDDDEPNPEDHDGSKTQEAYAAVKAFDHIIKEMPDKWKGKQGVHVKIDRDVFEIYKRKSEQSGSHGGAAMSTRVWAGSEFRKVWEKCRESMIPVDRMAARWAVEKVFDPIFESRYGDQSKT